MSTDDSISEDVSSSGALSHCHVSADGDVDVDGGKESEISCVSSEGTSASGLAGLEDGHAQTPKTSEGAAGSRPVDITPACDKIRSLCLGTDEAFEPEKSLPFINPSSLETLRGLVQEIQSSGETDPEMWKDCEGRWLHLFQLVEKQYQEQILAQQEQYQCQIQLIQDEIKALVQLQNRQSVWQPHTEFTPTSVAIANPATAAAAAAPKGYGLTFTSNDPAASIDLPKRGADCRTAASHAPLSSPSPPPQRAETGNPGRATVMSSGYGTLSAWETGREETGCPGEEEDNHGQPEGSRLPEDEAEGSVIACQQSLFNSHSIHSGTKEPSLSPCQQRSFSVKPLTSWAQRQKLRPRKSKAAWAPSLGQEGQEPPASPRESSGYSPAEHVDLRDQHLPPGASTNSFPLRRSHSLLSEASGLTYWRLNENDLYHPLPDSLDSGAYLCLQEPATSGSGTLPQEAQRSLKEIYQSKQKMASKCADWDASFSSCPSSPQVLTLDPSLHTRQSDRTSGSTSPSRFGSPSFPPQLPLCPGVGTPVTPDGTGRCGAHPGNTDSASSTSSLLPLTTTSPKGVQSAWGSPSQAAPSAPRDETEPCFFITSQQHGAGALLANEEEEGRHAHTSTLKPGPASSCASSRASPRVQGATPLEDPVVLSLLRQNLREKHARHVADLKAYYESEIQALRDRLGLQDLPRDVERSNRALRERCRHLEKELSEATRRVQEAEVKHSFLEKKLEEWPERYAVAGAAVKSLQQRLEDSKRSGGEKDALAERLRARVRHLEEALQNACRETDEKEARREREHKMLQDLLGEYDSLRKDCEAGKDKLLSTENKLVDANEHVSELNRVISKLESQVKQLEHESQARLRFVSHGNTQPSGAGLFHHPDLLLSPSNTEPNVTLRRSPCSAADQTNGGRKSAFPQTNQSNGQKKSPNPSHDHSPLPGAPLESYAGWSSPLPDRQQTWHQSPAQEAYGGPRDPGGREGPSPLTPVMRALMELEETRATESRAPWVGNQRATMGFVERRHKEPVHDRDKETSNAGTGLRGPERAGVRSSARPERPAALLRVQKSLSPDGHRSSSLPPSAHRSLPPATPTKRDTLLTPLSAKSSPKRSPTENYSTLFGHLLPRQQHLQNSLHRLDGIQDQRRHSVHNPSPRKRLQFSAPNEEEDSVAPGSPGSAYPSEGSAQLGWDEPGRPAVPNVRGVSCEYPGPPLLDRVHTLGEAEKLCDELTQEKLQVFPHTSTQLRQL